MKKSVMTLGLALIMILSMTLSVFAYDRRTEYTAKKMGYSFTNEWQITYVGGYDKIVMGYDTDWIDQDYCWTWHKKKETRATVYNDKKVAYDTERANYWAKAEITHKANPGYIIEY